jgi:hypothetical protein
MQEFKLIVAGGRDFDDYELLSTSIMTLANGIYEDKGVSIVSGMARGADKLAVQFARTHNVKLYEFPADWNTLGKGAGFVRNAQMAAVSHGLLSFWDGESRGTKHMIETMHKLNKPVFIIKY